MLIIKCGWVMKSIHKMLFNKGMVSAFLATFLFTLTSSMPEASCAPRSKKNKENAIDQNNFRDHTSAVGLITVRTGRNMEDRGTATLVEPGIILSAAHVFREVLPRGPLTQKNGPLHVDLRHKLVYWFYQPSTSGRPMQRVRVLSMVVDARYINAVRDPHQPHLSQEAQQHDIAFLELDPGSALPRGEHIPLFKSVSALGQMCASFGYGTPHPQMQPRRLHIVYRLDLAPHLQSHDVVNLSAMDNRPLGNPDHARQELTKLTCDPTMGLHDAYIGKALHGDSGGPLLVVTDGGVRVMGVMSVQGFYENERGLFGYNGFSSLITGARHTGYQVSQRVTELRNHLKRNMRG
jgi:hypothetical protein